MRPIGPISLAEIQAARQSNAGGAIRTPLVRMPVENEDVELYLKLENLQPIGSFKLRGAGHAIAKAASHGALSRGVYTASVGNMAIGVAWSARRLGIPCRVVAPDTAHPNKIAAIEQMGAEVIRVSFAEWWKVIVQHHHPGVEGRFIHPVSNPDVIAGHGAIGLEILEDLPDVDTVLVPFGGGGLSCGIASALRPTVPGARIFACEVETAAQLAPAWAAGEPREVNYTPSFVEGIGGKTVLPEMWPLVRHLLAGSIVVSLEQIATAIRLIAERSRTVAEGAGAATVAAALTGQAGSGKIVCVISGGNLGRQRLTTLLAGGIPPASGDQP